MASNKTTRRGRSKTQPPAGDRLSFVRPRLSFEAAPKGIKNKAAIALQRKSNDKIIAALLFFLFRIVIISIGSPI